MKKNYLLLTVFICCILLTSCATLFGPKVHPLSIDSDPNGAIVYVNGEKKGATPLKLELTADKTYTVKFVKEGYKNVIRTVTSKVGTTWIVLDILGAFIPVIVDAKTGNWKKLSDDTVVTVLEKS